MSRLKEIQKRRNNDDPKWGVEDRSYLLDELKFAMGLLHSCLRYDIETAGPMVKTFLEQLEDGDE